MLVHIGWAMLIAAFIGVTSPLLNRRYGKEKWAVFMPTASTLGLAFIRLPT